MTLSAILFVGMVLNIYWRVHGSREAEVKSRAEAETRLEQAQRLRWAVFEEQLSPTQLRAYLKRLPDFEDVEAENRAMQHALGFRSFSAALHFFKEWPDQAHAAQLVQGIEPAEADADDRDVERRGGGGAAGHSWVPPVILAPSSPRIAAGVTPNGSPSASRRTDRRRRHAMRDCRRARRMMGWPATTARGIVTMEDLVEEVVGDIADEHDPALRDALELDGVLELAGTMNVLDVRSDYHIAVPEGDWTTLGGYTFVTTVERAGDLRGLLRDLPSEFRPRD